MIKHRCIVVGGGASGAFFAAVSGKTDTVIVEKNGNIGKKLGITGKGRCNVTNNTDLQGLIKNVRTNPGFLYSAFSAFSSDDTISFFEELGVPLKTERGNRVFPVSDKASDIVSALSSKIKKNGIPIIKSKVVGVSKNDGVFSVRLSDGDTLYSENLLISTGGLSYPKTGSDGDGYKFAESFGHTVVRPTASLVPLVLAEKELCISLQGLSLKNTGLKIERAGKAVYNDFGEMIFTHFGVSGPMILSGSAYSEKGDRLILDLKPALDEKQLDKRILSDFGKYINKNFANSLSDLLPSKMIPVIVGLSGISPYKKVNEITSEERKTLVYLIKNLTFTVDERRPVSEAIITAGGVSVKEINPKTMMSKIVDGLYFSGEIIDVDAYTGGFNLQIAFSTAYLAARDIFD